MIKRISMKYLYIIWYKYKKSKGQPLLKKYTVITIFGNTFYC